MESTYRNFTKLAKLYVDQNADINEVALEYQSTQDPICFSFIFCKYYPFMKTVAQKYFYFTEQDKASICVEVLNKALHDFNPQRAKIQTLFGKYLSNRFLTEMKNLTYDKRKGNNNAESLQVCRELRNPSSDFDDVEVMESLSSMNLSKNELKYCQIIVSANSAFLDSDIARTLGISPSGVNQLKKSLSRKLKLA